jgi:hypothetical protein
MAYLTAFVLYGVNIFTLIFEMVGKKTASFFKG